MAISVLALGLLSAVAGSCAGAFGDSGGEPSADASCTLMTLYTDADGDQFGDPDRPISTCDVSLMGAVANADDCDDSNANVYPDAVEICDGLDNDCNNKDDDGLCASECADGEREGFSNLLTATNIAGCAGSFRVPGVAAPLTRTCSSPSGDDAANSEGLGCGSLDLCVSGWHVCASAAEVVASTTTGGCTGATKAGDPPLFFATSQSGPGMTNCGSGANDLFGCGNIGAIPAASCAPLNRFSNELCADLMAPWECGVDGQAEAVNVTKPAPERGGVLCCRDLPL